MLLLSPVCLDGFYLKVERDESSEEGESVHKYKTQ